MGTVDRSQLRTLQIGMGWFPEQPGGLNRYFFELVRHLPSVGVGVRGLVSGSARPAQDSSGSITSFGGQSDSSFGAGWECGVTPVPSCGWIPTCFRSPTSPSIHSRSSAPSATGPGSSISTALGPRKRSPKALEPGAASVKAMIERPVYTRATRCIALSRAFAAVLEQSYGVAAERIRIIPGGVDVNRFSAAGSRENARRELGWPTDRPIVLAVRRLARRMGLDLLISAARVVRAQVPEVLFLIAGRGAMAGELAARITDSGLDEHVRLLGYVPDEQLPRMYRAADLSIVPTVALEGFGLIAAESLASGTPVLVTPIGGLPEVVQGLAADLVLPAVTEGAIAAGLTSALTGRTRLPSEAACSQFARTHYAWPMIAGRIRQTYQEALQA